MKYTNKYLLLTKLEEDRPNRNGVHIGSQLIQGYCLDGITPGQQLYLYSSNEDVVVMGYTVPKQELLTSWTSTVVSLDEDNDLLKTKNSLYKIEIKEQ